MEKHGFSNQLVTDYFKRLGFTSVQEILDYKAKKANPDTATIRINDIHFNADECQKHNLSRFVLRYYVDIYNCKTIDDILKIQSGKNTNRNIDDESLEYKNTYSRLWTQRKNQEYESMYGIPYGSFMRIRKQYGCETPEEALQYYKPKKSHSNFKKQGKQQAHFELQTKINNLERLITNPEIREPRISKLRAEFEEIYGEIII